MLNLPLPTTESLTIEFKSDRTRLPDRDLVEALVGLANAEGGTLFLGVEDDGRPTGLHQAHLNLDGLPATVANLTRPPLVVRVNALNAGAIPLALIEVPKSRRIIATVNGVALRRRLRPDGSPENVPMYPSEFVSREVDLGLLDYSALPVEASIEEDLDPLERVRLRQMIERYRGDQALLPLTDPELDEALGFMHVRGSRRIPTVSGLLVLGKERALKTHLPTHEVAFQVLEGTEVRVNTFHRTPLLRAFEHLDEQFRVRYVEQELAAGLFRVPIPNFDPRAFREALVNAFVHRDYTRLGAVHVLWEGDGITFSNPGGFPEGVTQENLLTVRPTPRNPILADAIKRIGIAERTGRGVDRIFEGLLRFGRPAPDYSASGATGVSVKLSGGQADLNFLKGVLMEERRRGEPLSVDALIVLTRLRHERRLATAELAHAIQRSEPTARTVLEKLVESGLIEAHGNTHRSYTLSSRLYREFGESVAYVRQSGIEPIRQEEMVLRLVRTKGTIKRGEVIDLCRLTESQAKGLLARLVKDGRLVQEGQKRGAFYRLKT